MTITSDSYFRNQVLQCVVCMLVNSSNIINYTLKNCNDIEYSKMLLKLFMVWFSIMVFNSNAIWCIWYIWCSLIDQKNDSLIFQPSKIALFNMKNVFALSPRSLFSAKYKNERLKNIAHWHDLEPNNSRSDDNSNLCFSLFIHIIL